MANLVMKRLMKLQPGARVEITRNDRDRSIFTGVVSDNDFEESLEIQGDFGELILSYSEVASVIVLQNGASAEPRKSEPSRSEIKTTQEQVPIQPQPTATKLEKLSFYTEIKYPKLGDFDLETYYKETLSPEERKLAMNMYQSYKYKMKNNEFPACAAAAAKMITTFDYADSEVSERAYRFAFALQVRANAKPDYACLMDFDAYDYLAVYHYLEGEYDKSVAYACLALIKGSEQSFQNVLFTILSKETVERADTSGLVYILNENSELLLNAATQELLNFIYMKSRGKMPATLNRSELIRDLNSFCQNTAVAQSIQAVLDQNKKEEPKPAPTPTSVPAPTATTASRAATPIKKPAPRIKRGEIFYISWGDEWGKIAADGGGEYRFQYADIADKELAEKIKTLKVRDLRAENLVVRVEFSVCDGKISVTRELFQRVVPPAPPVSSKPKNESSLKTARRILADATNDRRFEDSLPYLEAALSEEEDPLIPLAEFFNCCVAAAKRNSDGSYDAKAYEAYLKYKDRIEKTVGIGCNVAVMDLMIRLKKTDEAIQAAGRILADPKISPEVRLHYIYGRAQLLMERANAVWNNADSSPKDVVQAYETACSAYMDWEQRFSSMPTFRSNPAKKNMYFNLVLLEIAKCLIKTGDSEKAKEILKRILNFDASNDNARKLFQQLIAEENAVDAAPDGENDEEDASEDLFIDDYYDDSDDEEQTQFEEYKDVSGWDALGLDAKDVVAYAVKALAENHGAAGIAYLKAASDLNSDLTAFYRMVSYATNHPMENLNYRLDNVTLQFNEKFPTAETFVRYAQAAAFLRGSFYHTADNDYFLASAYVDKEIISAIPAFGLAFEYIEGFRAAVGKGMDLYADYRYRSDDYKASAMLQLSKDAKLLYDRYFGRLFHETVSQKRFKITKSIVFEKGGFLERILNCVVNNNAAEFQQLQPQFAELFIRDDTSVFVGNIDPAKIEAYVDEAWAQAGKDKTIHEKSTSRLMGSLRNNIRIPIGRIVETVCVWLTLNSEANSDFAESDLVLYRTKRAGLLSALTQAEAEIDQRISDFDVQIRAGLSLLNNCVREIAERVEGSWTEGKRRYFFADFLRADRVLLNDEFLPDLTFTFCDMPTFNILARIRAHVETQDSDMVSYAETIYSREPEKHDFGTAEKIAEYLKFIGKESEWTMPEDSDSYDEQARKQLRDCFDRFNVDIASAFSRGQIKTSDAFLQSVDATAQSVYQYCMESSNYGFFFRFIALCKEMIHVNAMEYGVILEQQLEHLATEENMDDATYQKISGFIETQQFTVAEEMMDQVAKGTIGQEEDFPIRITDYLTRFWDEFDANYSAIARDRGNSLVKIVSSRGAMKDRRGGEALVNNWPRSDRCSAEQIVTLLRLLGWPDVEVEKSSIAGTLASFMIRQKSGVFSQREYPHPIAAFGTQAYNDGFYVVCLFGTTDGTRLVDICKRLDSVTGNKILLIDFALSAGERRRLARLMKQVSFANTYLFVDRVSLLYLANHYVGGVGDANNRALFAISMPFTYYQPYGLGSSSATAPELFSGRKEELLSVESPQGANLIYGGRQLGKTAILKKAVNETHDPENGRYAFAIDIKEKNCREAALKVSRWLSAEGIFTDDQITDDWETFAFYLRKNIIDKSISYILLMLDEADCFIDDCKTYEYAPFVALKDIQQSMNGRFKFVLAGLHDIVKFKRDVALGNNSVIAHLSYINVKPFDYATAKILLRDPLSYLGFDFEDDDVSFMQICSATNYYPGLLQFFCHKLIEELKSNYGGYNETDTPSYKVTPRHIGKVLADREFKAAIKEKFEITLRLGEGNYYYVLALLLALLYDDNESAEGYDIEAIIKMSSDIGVDLPQTLTENDIRARLEELCDLNILKMIGNGYAFRTRSFRDLLGSRRELEDQLLEMLSV